MNRDVNLAASENDITFSQEIINVLEVGEDRVRKERLESASEQLSRPGLGPMRKRNLRGNTEGLHQLYTNLAINLPPAVLPV